MSDTTLTWLADSWLYDVLAALFIGGIFVPGFLIAAWYARRASRTEGGRDLLQKQNENAPVPKLDPKLGKAMGMARDIEAGAYGRDIRRLQRWTYALCALWITLLFAYLAFVIWLGTYATKG